MAEASQETRMEIGTYITGLPQRQIVVSDEADSLFRRLRDYKPKEGMTPVLIAHTIRKPSKNYDPPLAENQIYVAFRKEPETAGLRNVSKLGSYVDGLNSSLLTYLQKHVGNIQVVNEGYYSLLGEKCWQGMFTKEDNPHRTLTTIMEEHLSNPRRITITPFETTSKEIKAIGLNCLSSFITLDKDKKTGNDITLGSVTYRMEKEGPMLIAVGIFIDSEKRHPIDRTHAISSSLAVESGKSMNKELVRREIVRAIAPFV